jgi:hypothetical protein
MAVKWREKRVESINEGLRGIGEENVKRPPNGRER